MAIAIAASVIIAVLSGLGVGGGGLFVVFLNLFTDLPQLTVQGINLLFFIFSSGSAVCVHIRKRKIYGGVVLLLALCGIVGAVFGIMLAGAVSDVWLRKIFGCMLVVSGIIALRKGKKKEKKEE